MIVGEHSREADLDVNPAKEKKLSNMRAAGSDEAIRLSPPRSMTIETALTYINEDEMVEITPSHIRLRKKTLDQNARRQMTRKVRKEAEEHFA